MKQICNLVFKYKKLGKEYAILTTFEPYLIVKVKFD